MNYKIIRKIFFIQVVTFILSSMASSIGSIIDGVIIGQGLGVEAIAAFGIINPLMIMFSLSGAIVASGARNRFSNLVSRGLVERAQGMFTMAVLLAVGMATALMIVLLIFAEPVTKLLGSARAGASLLPQAKAYLIGILFGLPGMNLARILSQFMAIDGDRTLPVKGTLTLVITNTLMDLLIIQVLHGGLFEIGLSTSLSYYFQAAVLLTHFRKKNILLKFTFSELHWKETKGILWHGLPVGFCRMGNTMRSTFMNRFLSMIASVMAIVAYSVHRQTDSLLNPITLGIADTVTVLSGILKGEENRPMMKQLFQVALEATLVITLPIALLMWLLAPQYASLYISDSPEALKLAIDATRCYAIGMPLYGLNVIYQNYFQGIGKIKLSSVSGFLLESALLVLSAVVLARFMGASAVWVAFPVTQLLMLVYYLVVVLVYNWKHGLHYKGLRDKLLLLPESFDVPEDCRIDISISSYGEVQELSQAVWNFCKEHGCDRRRQIHMSLATEEMINNIIDHGFAKDKKPHSIDVRVLKKDDDYILRIRDDCFIFDPIKQIKLIDNNDRLHHNGLYIVSKTAKKMEYSSIMKLNNLLIRI